MIPLLYMSILYNMYIYIYYTVSTVITLHSHFQMGNNNNGLWRNFSIVLPVSVLSKSVCERRLQLYYNYYYYIV